MPDQPDSAPETFDEAVARHVAGFRARREGWSTTVTSPVVDRAAREARERTETVMKVGFLCSAFTPVFVLLPYSGISVMVAWVLAGLWPFVCFVAFVVPAFTATTTEDEPSWVDVPDDAASAYEEFPVPWPGCMPVTPPRTSSRPSRRSDRCSTRPWCSWVA